MFHKDIGFNVAVLLTNLSEHMPHDTRLQTFLELAESVLNYFQPYLGRIEIMGSAKRIERVYFEISESSRTQWEKPQVKMVKQGQFICMAPFTHETIERALQGHRQTLHHTQEMFKIAAQKSVRTAFKGGRRAR